MPSALKPTRTPATSRSPKEPPEPGGVAKARTEDTGIERGVRVQVAAGPFRGKVGLVDDIDGKGGARVLLGLLPVRIELKHLTAHAEPRRRPVLATSHRKRPPARS